MMQVAGNTIFEFDATSGCRRNSVDVNDTPHNLLYTQDGNMLVLLTRVSGLLGFGKMHQAQSAATPVRSDATKTRSN
jgi:hypothetical protein